MVSVKLKQILLLEANVVSSMGKYPYVHCSYTVCYHKTWSSLYFTPSTVFSSEQL